jgi:electron transport complex protein RnfG
MAKIKKLASTFPNMLLVLTITAVASALALGFTYSLTKEARAMVEVKRTLAGIKKVLPEFDNKPSEKKYTVEGYEGLEFYPASKGGQPVGTAVKSFSEKGFSEDVWIMVGFDRDHKIYNVSVLKHKETPGLGSKMAEPRFKDQFKGKDPADFTLSVKKDGGDVDAISAATISSRAFCDALSKAYQAISQGGEK